MLFARYIRIYVSPYTVLASDWSSSEHVTRVIGCLARGEPDWSVHRVRGGRQGTGERATRGTKETQSKIAITPSTSLGTVEWLTPGGGREGGREGMEGGRGEGRDGGREGMGEGEGEGGDGGEGRDGGRERGGKG